MNGGILTTLAVFVAVGVLGGGFVYGAYVGGRRLLTRWREPDDSPRPYRLMPVGEPGVHDELGTPAMQRTRWRLEEARTLVPGNGGAWQGAIQISEHSGVFVIDHGTAVKSGGPSLPPDVDETPDPGDETWATRDSLLHWALRYRN